MRLLILIMNYSRKLYFFLHILPLVAMYTVQPIVYMMGGPPRDTTVTTTRAPKDIASKGPENGAKPEQVAQSHNDKAGNPADGTNPGPSIKMKTG